MDKVVLTAWAVYLAGIALYPLVEGLVSGLSPLSEKRHRPGNDRDFEVFLALVVKPVFWPVIAIGWLWVRWTKIFGRAGEWVHDWLADE